MKKYTNKETSRLRLHRRTKTALSILATILVLGAGTVAMNTSFNNAAPDNEVLEASTCTADVKAAQTMPTATTMTTTSLQTSTVVSTSTSTSTAILSTDYLQTETQIPTRQTATQTTTTTTTTAVTTLTSTATQTTTTATSNDWTLPITQTEYMYLANLVGHEYGSYWVPTAERAKVVAVVMNRVRDPRFPNTIYGVLTAPCQFTGWSSYGAYGYTAAVKQVPDCMAAVDYYFAHQSEFPNWLSFDGNHYAADGSGPYNYFRF